MSILDSISAFVTVLILAYASVIIFANGIGPIWQLADVQLGAFGASGIFEAYVPSFVSFAFFGTVGFIVFIIGMWAILNALARIGRGLVR